MSLGTYGEYMPSVEMTDPPEIGEYRSSLDITDGKLDGKRFLQRSMVASFFKNTDNTGDTRSVSTALKDIISVEDIQKKTYAVHYFDEGIILDLGHKIVSIKYNNSNNARTDTRDSSLGSDNLGMIRQNYITNKIETDGAKEKEDLVEDPFADTDDNEGLDYVQIEADKEFDLGGVDLQEAVEQGGVVTQTQEDLEATQEETDPDLQQNPNWTDDTPLFGPIRTDVLAHFNHDLNQQIGTLKELEAKLEALLSEDLIEDIGKGITKNADDDNGLVSSGDFLSRYGGKYRPERRDKMKDSLGQVSMLKKSLVSLKNQSGRGNAARKLGDLIGTATKTDDIILSEKIKQYENIVRANQPLVSQGVALEISDRHEFHEGVQNLANMITTGEDVNSETYYQSRVQLLQKIAYQKSEYEAKIIKMQEQQRVKAEEFLDTEMNYLNRIDQLRSARDKWSALFTDLEDEFTGLESSHDVLQSKYSDLKSSNTSLQDSKVKLQQSQTSLERELGKAQEDHQALTELYKKSEENNLQNHQVTKDQIAALESKLTTSEVTITRLQTTIDEQNQALKESQQDLITKQQTYANQKGDVDGKVKTLQAALRESKATNTETSAKLTSALNEVSRLSDKNTAANKKIARYTSEITALKRENTALQNQLDANKQMMTQAAENAKTKRAQKNKEGNEKPPAAAKALTPRRYRNVTSVNPLRPQKKNFVGNEKADHNPATKKILLAKYGIAGLVKLAKTIENKSNKDKIVYLAREFDKKGLKFGSCYKFCYAVYEFAGLYESRSTKYNGKPLKSKSKGIARVKANGNSIDTIGGIKPKIGDWIYIYGPHMTQPHSAIYLGPGKKTERGKTYAKVISQPSRKAGIVEEDRQIATSYKGMKKGEATSSNLYGHGIKKHFSYTS